MGKEKIKEEKKEKEVITALYKVRLHCPQCAREIRSPLLTAPGVHKVDVKYEKNEVEVTGAIDAKKIHKRLEKWTKKKVELVSQKDVKKESTKTVKLKMYMHCDKCERDIKRRLLKHKGIHNVKTDIKAQTITLETVVESEKIVTYVRKSLGKHAEIVTTKKKEKEKDDDEDEKIVEFKEVKKVEVKVKEKSSDGSPYFVHYVYAPQWFSDENPNACLIM